MHKLRGLRRGLLRCAIGCAGAIGIGSVPAFAVPYSLLTTISIPVSSANTTGGELTSFDISYFDGDTQTYYLSDRSNNGVDVLSAATNSFITRVGTGTFSGAQSSPDISGPDGVMVANGQLWAGNGDSTVHVYNFTGNTYTAAPSISTGMPPTPVSTTKRSDEMAYDPTDKVAIVANDAATPSPYVNLINATTNTVTKQIVMNGSGGTPNATGGIEQSVWMPSNDMFYVSIPQIGTSGPGGIAEINPLTGAVVNIYNLASFGISSCSPAGLVKGNGNQLLIGCANAGTQTILFDPTANGNGGAVLKTFDFSGSDEVAFDAANNMFFVTDSAAGLLGIINGMNDTFLGSVATATGAHSVAVDPVSGEVFVPLGAGPNNKICSGGCVAVYAPVPEPSSLTLLAAAGIMLVGTATATRRRRRDKTH